MNKKSGWPMVGMCIAILVVVGLAVSGVFPRFGKEEEIVSNDDIETTTSEKEDEVVSTVSEEKEEPNDAPEDNSSEDTGSAVSDKTIASSAEKDAESGEEEPDGTPVTLWNCWEDMTESHTPDDAPTNVNLEWSGYLEDDLDTVTGQETLHIRFSNLFNALGSTLTNPIESFTVFKKENSVKAVNYLEGQFVRDSSYLASSGSIQEISIYIDDDSEPVFQWNESNDATSLSSGSLDVIPIKIDISELKEKLIIKVVANPEICLDLKNLILTD